MTACLISINPRTGEGLGEVAATPLAHVDAACDSASLLFDSVTGRSSDPVTLLRTLADALESRAKEVVELLDLETALGAPRLNGELARTAYQLRAFADFADSPQLWQPLIDTADPARVPPRTDQRRVNVPVGPVAVFAASNFPLAFGILGGDTTSALAAGCPVVVKAHPAQPLGSAMLAELVAEAISIAGVDTAWLTVVAGDGVEIGRRLVEHPAIAAVGFTGSGAGGQALVHAAAARPRPIPVFAEMGSVNPSFVGPGAARSRAAEIGRSWASTLVANAGQLCTQPGMLIVPTKESAADVVAGACQALSAAIVPPLLSPRLAESFSRALDQVSSVSGVRGHRVDPAENAGTRVSAAVLETDASSLMAAPEAMAEMFGPAGLVIVCPHAQLPDFLRALPGSLASGVIADSVDGPWVSALVPGLQRLVGRIVYNTWPTGVSVGLATVHGGPWPATSYPATTSVGLTAAWRFVRPVAYEHFPQDLLPSDLQD